MHHILFLSRLIILAMSLIHLLLSLQLLNSIPSTQKIHQVPILGQPYHHLITIRPSKKLNIMILPNFLEETLDLDLHPHGYRIM